MTLTSSTCAVPHRPLAIEAVYALGYELLDAQNYTSAGDVFRLMVRVAPQDERGWIALAKCHEGLGQDEVAREILGTGRLFAKPSVRCEVALSRVAMRLGAADVAHEALLRARAIAEDAGDEGLLLLVQREMAVSP